MPRRRHTRLRLCVAAVVGVTWAVVASANAGHLSSSSSGGAAVSVGGGTPAFREASEPAAGKDGEVAGLDDRVPEDIASAVSATAAESLLMGIFVLICSFELRGVKAGMVMKANGLFVAQVSTPQAASRAQSGGSLVPPTRSMSVISEHTLAAEGLECRASALGDDDAGSIYGLEDIQDMARQESTASQLQACWKAEREKWQIGPLVMMMILLHVIYPSFPISPQVEVGRIMTFLGFLWSVGPMRCIAVVNTEPLVRSRLVILTVLCACVHGCIFVMTDTVSDLIFPNASDTTALYHGPRYLHQLLVYLTVRYPARSASFGPWAAWFVVSAVVLASAVWKEFLFRGVYLGGLRTRMPFWAANVTVALIYALSHEPLALTADGTLRLHMVACAPLLMGSMWYGYLYQSCNNLVVTVLAHLLFNTCLFGLHLVWGADS